MCSGPFACRLLLDAGGDTGVVVLGAATVDSGAGLALVAAGVPTDAPTGVVLVLPGSVVTGPAAGADATDALGPFSEGI